MSNSYSPVLLSVRFIAVWGWRVLLNSSFGHLQCDRRGRAQRDVAVQGLLSRSYDAPGAQSLG